MLEPPETPDASRESFDSYAIKTDFGLDSFKTYLCVR